MPTTVVHCRRGKFDVYIGRACQEFPASKWANPFKIGIDGSRHEVLQKYEQWVPTQPKLMASLDEIRGRILGCWCHQRPCHGHILAKLADGVGKSTVQETSGNVDPAPAKPKAAEPTLFDDP